MVERGPKEILAIADLRVEYPTENGTVRAVRGVDLQVKEGEILGLVGESGCGKSATLLATMRLVPFPGKITSGQIILDGQNILELDEGEVRKVRGKTVSMILQDPMSALNPAHKIGTQIKEALNVHGLWNRTEDGQRQLVKLLERVGIPSPETVLELYPHQLSGGMQQRVMIAIALACRPKLILADEPTTALDVTIQAQILDLLANINKDNGTAIILVTHNLAVASQFCHRIAVMYAGQIIEEGPTDEVLSNPLHPYTQGLLNCLPRFQRRERLTSIPGQVPDLTGSIPGCAFYPRCSRRARTCRLKNQRLMSVDGRRKVRCERWRINEVFEERVLEEELDMVVDHDRDQDQ